KATVLVSHQYVVIDFIEPPHLTCCIIHLGKICIREADVRTDGVDGRCIQAVGGADIKMLVKKANGIAARGVRLVGLDVFYRTVYRNEIDTIVECQPKVLVAIDEYPADIVFLKAFAIYILL